MLNKSWSPSSWIKKKKYGMAHYPDAKELVKIKKSIMTFPQITYPHEVLNLKKSIKKCNQNNAFILQIGHQEYFDKFSYETSNKIAQLLIEMGIIHEFESGRELIKLAGVAGEYSMVSDYSGNNPTYFGDLTSSKHNTNPDPTRLFTGYFMSISTMNVLRNFQLEEREFKLDTTARIIEKIKSIQFFDFNIEQFKPNIYTAHNCIHLDYEQSLIRPYVNNSYFCSSSHFLLLDPILLQPNSAQVEFLRRIQNPIGIKCNPETTFHSLHNTIQLLNPNNDDDKIIIITQYKYDEVSKYLDNLIFSLSVKKSNVIYICNPVSQNIHHIKSEIKQTRAILESYKTWLSGIHLQYYDNLNNNALDILQEIK